MVFLVDLHGLRNPFLLQLLLYTEGNSRTDLEWGLNGRTTM